MKIFCDMDGVLVRQTAPDGFDAMPWMQDGRELWDFIKPYGPTLLTLLPAKKLERCGAQKLIWVRRELGIEVPIIATPDNVGKAPYAVPGAVLIDDNESRHAKDWTAAGGVFVHHRSAAGTIAVLKGLLQ